MSGHSTEERYVVTADTRRRWSRMEKLAIVAEVGTGSVSAVARRHNVAPSLLFRWRRELGEEGAGSSKPSEEGLVRVSLPAPVARHQGAAPSDRVGSGEIEIVLSGGHRVIVGRGFEAASLKLVIGVLEGR